ncbi:MAG: molybdopterin-guanine dinucleotide biosynthesis protein B [Planctomycetaceae bacterium]|nr:molybdopterin-guanine dinucleotide biosynthesis protein B [Planctomycetaceae bacterium]
MYVLHIVGRKNHGKTTLIVDLVMELTSRGISVGTIKHSGKGQEIDRAGTDSHRHRIAGASPAAIMTDGLTGVYIPRLAGDDAYESVAPLMAECDVVLVEGDLERRAPKIEVWREAFGTPCLAAERDDVLAVVTDDRPAVSTPVWPRRDIVVLADRVLGCAELMPSIGFYKRRSSFGGASYRGLGGFAERVSFDAVAK